MEIFALIGNLAVKSCEFTDGAPPTIRPFLFTAKCLVEITKFRQGLFQRLWVLDFLTRAKCQVSVFHTEVCPNVLTCCRQRVGICEVRRDTQPIVTAIITLYRYASDITVPLAVLEKNISHSIIYPLARIRIPFTEVNSDTIVFYFPARLSGKGHRLELMSRFDMRSATQFFQKTLIGSVIRLSSS